MVSVTRRMSPTRKFSAALPSAVSIRTGQWASRPLLSLAGRGSHRPSSQRG